MKGRHIHYSEAELAWLEDQRTLPISDYHAGFVARFWEAVPRAILPRLAGGNRYRRKLAYDDAAPEVRPAIMAVAKLSHAAKVKGRGQ